MVPMAQCIPGIAWEGSAPGDTREQVNEFYKKGCQGKTSPSTGGREDFSLEIQPTVRKCPSIALEGFCSGLSALPVGFIFRW